MPKMGSFLGQWFVYTLVISLITALVAAHTVSFGAGKPYTFHVIAVVAFLGYAGSQAQFAIWAGQPWSSTLKSMFDGLLYALVTAGTFTLLFGRDSRWSAWALAAQAAGQSISGATSASDRSRSTPNSVQDPPPIAAGRSRQTSIGRADRDAPRAPGGPPVPKPQALADPVDARVHRLVQHRGRDDGISELGVARQKRQLREDRPIAGSTRRDTGTTSPRCATHRARGAASGRGA